jgi:hypothetical protein
MTMCYGQCFLERNLGLADDAQKNTAPSGKQKIDLPIFIISEAFYTFQEVSALPEMNTHYSLIPTSVCLASPFHPPTVG